MHFAERLFFYVNNACGQGIIVASRKIGRMVMDRLYR